MTISNYIINDIVALNSLIKFRLAVFGPTLKCNHSHLTLTKPKLVTSPPIRTSKLPAQNLKFQPFRPSRTSRTLPTVANDVASCA